MLFDLLPGDGAFQKASAAVVWGRTGSGCENRPQKTETFRDLETYRLRNLETFRLLDLETYRLRNLET